MTDATTPQATPSDTLRMAISVASSKLTPLDLRAILRTVLENVEASMLQIIRHKEEEIAEMRAALGEASAPSPPKAPRKPRAARAETMPEQQEAYVFESLKIKSPQTLAEVAKMAGVTRGQAQIAIDSLLTDGRVTRERAGKGWRYSHAPLDVESMRTLETR